jgi:hypothetical protein
LLTSNYNNLDSNYNIISIKNYVDNRVDLKPINNFYPDYFFVFLNDFFKKNNVFCDYICISMYRKIVTRAPIGRPTSNFSGMNLSNDKFVSEELLEFDKSTKFLLCKPLFFQEGIVGQYYRKHCKKDFDQFARMLIPSATLSEKELSIFLNQNVLIPAAPLGVVPYNVFIYIAEKISKFIMYTDTNGYHLTEPTHPYQSKARSFFVERLSSFLTIQKMIEINNSNNFDTNNFGYTITFTDNIDTDKYSGGNI